MWNVKVIIFDLDNTLYNELDYVYSGFKAVANYFNQAYSLPFEETYYFMIEELKTKGRGKIFNSILSKYKLDTLKNVKRAVSVYRLHTPKITLPESSKDILNYYSNKPIYIVTDGNKIVQAKKIEALGLNRYIKKAFITHQYGLKYAKPSTYCFEKIASIEKVHPEEIVYIGDDIEKDFVGIKPLGFKTMRLKTYNSKDYTKSQEYYADIEIDHINELTNILN